MSQWIQVVWPITVFLTLILGIYIGYNVGFTKGVKENKYGVQETEEK